MVFPRFLIAGAVNTGLTYLLYLGLLLLMPYVWAYSLTYVVGIGLGYAFNAYWVFKKAPSIRSVTIYPLVYGINYLLGVMMLWLFVEWMGVPEKIAPLMAVIVTIPVMYGLTRSVFQKKSAHEKAHN